MKILHTVQFYHPSVGGMQEVVRQISERLVKLGHEVTVATAKDPKRTNRFINGVKIVEFDIAGNMVVGITGETGKYRDFLLNSDFDIITNFAAQQWATDIMMQDLEKISSKKVFVPTGFSALHFDPFKDYFNSMKTWMKQYDMNVFLSNNYQDINFARENGVEKLLIIPNGASEDEFLAEADGDIRQKLGIPKEHFLILHVGSHTGEKGHDEAISIFNKAHINNATFLIVANSFGGGCTDSCRRKEALFGYYLRRLFDKKRLIITSLTRQETVLAYKEADLFLFPSNIECSPLVLFECMASKTPFLTTDVGNATEIIDWSGAGWLLPTEKKPTGHGKAVISKSVKLLEHLYANPQIREAMSQSGFKQWNENFTWGKIAFSYEKLYNNLLNY